MFEDDFPFLKVGYFSSLEGTFFCCIFFLLVALSSGRTAIFTGFSSELAQEKESNAIKRCIALAIKRLSAEAPWQIRNNGDGGESY